MADVLKRRQIDPEFFSAAQIDAISFAAQRLFMGLWCASDRNGCLEYAPGRIRNLIFANFPDVDIADLLQELFEANLIFDYEANDEDYLCIPTISKRQPIHKNEAQKCPAPPESALSAWRHREREWKRGNEPTKPTSPEIPAKKKVRSKPTEEPQPEKAPPAANPTPLLAGFVGSLRKRGLEEPADMKNAERDFNFLLNLDAKKDPAITEENVRAAICFLTQDIRETKSKHDFPGWGKLIRTPKQLRDKWSAARRVDGKGGVWDQAEEWAKEFSSIDLKGRWDRLVALGNGEAVPDEEEAPEREAEIPAATPVPQNDADAPPDDLDPDPIYGRELTRNAKKLYDNDEHWEAYTTTLRYLGRNDSEVWFYAAEHEAAFIKGLMRETFEDISGLVLCITSKETTHADALESE